MMRAMAYVALVIALAVMTSPEVRAAARAASEMQAEMVCAVLDQGITVESVVDLGIALAATGLTPEEAGALIGATAAERCPRHLPALKVVAARLIEQDEAVPITTETSTTTGGN